MFPKFRVTKDLFSFSLEKPSTMYIFTFIYRFVKAHIIVNGCYACLEAVP